MDKMNNSECSASGDSEDAEPQLSFFHVQPSSLSQGYESVFPEGHFPYQNSMLTTKIKTAKCRLREYSNWLDFKKPLDERRLCQAVSMNDTATVTHLLNQGVLASCYDSQGRSPLHLASCKGYAHIVKILLDHGADPNARDSIGNTPLHLAACTIHINVIMLLLKAGTNACSMDKLGRSPLQLAQSKLKFLHKANVTDEEIKDQVSQVIELLLHFSSVDTEMLSEMRERVQKSEGREEVDMQLMSLLDNLTLTEESQAQEAAQSS